MSAVMLVLIAWAFFSFIFISLGLLIRRSFGLKINDTEALLTSFWMGWALTIFFLQLWHFYFRIDWRALVLVSIGSITGLIWNRKDLWLLIKQDLIKNWFLYFITSLTALFLANHAVLPPANGDSGLYHFHSVRWATSFPIVPGLGNLHGRLAFNSPFFLYVAMLEIGFWIHKSHHLANGLLLLVLFAQIFLSGTKLLKNGGDLRLYHIFNILFFAPVLRPVLMGTNISSPSTDPPVFILGVVIFAQLLAFLEKSASTSEEDGYALFFIATIAVLGAIIKLSFLALGTVSLLLTFIVWFTRGGNQGRFVDKKTIVWVSLVTALALIPWMMRGVILSGYIAYPIPFGSFPVEWRIPYESVVNMLKWTRSWTRLPWVHYSKVLGNWDWFRPWAIRTFSNWFDVVKPLLLALAGCTLILFCRITNRYDRNIQRKTLLFLLPVVMSLIYWFITAPDIRHADVNFWILGVGTVAWSISYTKGLRSIEKSHIILFLCAALCLDFFPNGKIAFVKTLMKEKNINKAFQQLYITEWIIAPKKNGGFYDIPSVDLKTFVTDSGLAVYVPQKGNQCWDAPLPCTPKPDSELRLRHKENMRYGFLVYPEKE